VASSPAPLPKVAMSAAVLAPGFADPVHDAQRSFRRILDALAHPGRIVDVGGALAASPPAPLVPAAAAVLLALCDIDTRLWLTPDAATAAAYLRFHCGAPLVDDPAAADFALIAAPASLFPLDRFALGSDADPDRNATLVVQVAGFDAGGGVTLHGPGIDGTTRFGAAGLGAGFWAARQAMQALFPRGLDVVFASGTRLAALPRSTIVEG
jgi:alpha-D-ribose 1-methylphosphonate 5-triphosphate synthase subunit PhnH